MASVSGTMPRGPYRNGVKRREQIVETASKVFAEFGYTGGSIRAIAARVDVSPASLIQLFGSKEGLLEAVLEDWQRQTVADAHADVSGLAFLESMRALMQFHLKHRGLIELFLTMTAEASRTSHPARPFIQRRYARSIEEFESHMRVACDLGEIAPLSDAQIETEVRLMFAVMNGLELQWLLDPTVDLTGLFDEHLDEAIRRWKSAPTTPAVAAVS